MKTLVEKLKMYRDELLGTAANEHIWQLGAENAEARCMHHDNHEKYAAQANYVSELIKKIENCQDLAKEIPDIEVLYEQEREGESEFADTLGELLEIY